MSYFVFGSGISYSDYLKSKSYFDDLRIDNQSISFDISKQTREIISSIDNLAQQGIDLLSSPHGNEKLDRLSYSVQDMMTISGEFTPRIHCAFGHLLIPDDKCVSYYDDLNKSKLQSPSMKLYERARKLFADNQYQAAYDELLNIIELSKDSPAAKPDWRHYQMLGVLYLGFVDCDFNLINLPKAEQAFLEAYQCSKDDNAFESAKALMLAGWAAYCQGRIHQALKYTEDAAMMSRLLAEAKFLVAKILISQNNTEKALVYLGKAIEAEPFYAIKAAGDGDFKKHVENLRPFMEQIRDRYATYLTKLIDVFESNIADPDIKLELQNKINSAIEDESLYKYVFWYKELSTAIWIITEGVYALTEVRSVVVKQEFWYSSKSIEQVRDEHSIQTLNYSLIGNKHTIDLAFSSSLVISETGNFYIGRTQVTQGLWTEVMGYKAFATSGSNFPAYEVNWYDCINFCNKLSIKLNLKPCYHIDNDYNPLIWTKGPISFDTDADGFRLPTEAEWEFAAKGGDYTHKYPYSGSSEAVDVAWFDKNSRSKLSPVALKMPNELGLYDMSGNVWEWCWDTWNDTDRRILRGGAFFSSAALCAVSGRGHGSAANAGIANGFRLVRNAKAQIAEQS